LTLGIRLLRRSVISGLRIVRTKRIGICAIVDPDSNLRSNEEVFGFPKEGGSDTVLFDGVNQDLDTRLTEPYP
jgi:hypothetical protein